MEKSTRTKESRRSKVKDSRSLREKRLMNVFGLIAIMICLLASRLFYIQIVQGEEYNKRAFEQWFHIIGNISDRGTIYDRNREPLTDKIQEDYLVLELGFYLDDNNSDIINKLTNIEKDKISKILEQEKKVELLIKNYDKALIMEILRNRGASTIRRSKRYDEDGLASHVIGYINKSKNIGVSGLEKAFNSELGENRGKKVGAILDAQNRIIPGFGYIVMEKKDVPKRNLITTLDSGVEKICEEELDRNNYIGSVVVLDAKTGDILAMASRPNFNQNNVGEHLESNEKELYNKAIQISYPPGSVFKIIVAAALLENDVIKLEDKLVCKGFEMLGINMIKCNTYEKGGHGELTFEEAFALSCNSAFIQGAKNLGGEKLMETMKKFGIGRKTGIKINEETNGILPTMDYVKGPGIGNIAIGQGTVEVTPLQVAKFTNVIANDGIDVGVRLVKAITDDKGKIIDEFDSREINRVVSSDTANKIKKMMKDVVEEGTGKRAKLEGGESYGKTGSAQAVGLDGETVHAWFTGFFLGKKSEYVITVIVEDKRSGGRIATPIFAEIAKRMIEMGL
ncbi:peptidoglycan D,D-transpeptidase FtsI family protein [Wukongibacter sp. M2B1]|uniref:peptidoglycan D,D-transpeptidase FtsI family protein n=1 Tax=Wukongibacter sp. M2B1 TaxID=3088895 RepID=UPI003D7C0E02